MSIANKRGFTLVEAIASAALLAVGISASLQAVAAVEHGWSNISVKEKLQRLASRKLGDLIVQGDVVNPDQGDLSTWNLPDYQWSSSIQTTPEQELSDIVVKVWQGNNPNDSRSSEELVYVPPTNQQGAP